MTKRIPRTTKGKTELRPQEKAILVSLLKRKSWANTTQLAKSSDVSWNTADKYLKRMYGRGWLKKDSNFWKARRKK